MSRLPARAFAALGSIALVVYFFLSPGAADLAYDVSGPTCAAAIGWAILRQRITRYRGPWLLFAAANLVFVTGDIGMGLVPSAASGAAPFPSIGDGVHLLGYPILAAAILWGAKIRGPRRDVLSVIDGVMVALAAAIPVYVLWISPALRSSGLSTLGEITSVAYPVMDLLLIVAGVRFALSSGAMNRAAMLLWAGVGLSIISDVAYNVALLHGTYAPPSPIDFGWLAASVLWGTAALHPSVDAVLARGANAQGASLRSRAWVVVAIVALPLGVIAYSFVQGTTLSVGAVLLPLMLIALLMFGRLATVARSGSIAWRGPALLATAALMIIAVSVGLTELHARTQREQKTSDVLAGELAQIERIDGLALRATQGDGPSIAYLEGSTHAGRALIRQALGDLLVAATEGERGTLTGLGGAYLKSLSAEVGLIRARRWEDAQLLNQSQVKSRHDDLVGAVRSASRHYQVRAANNAKAGRIGTVMLLLLGLGLLSLLLLRFGAASRAAQIAAERGLATADSERRIRALVAGSADILTVIDESSRVIAYSESAEAVLKYADGTIAGTQLTELLGSDDAGHTLAILAALASRPGASETLAWKVRRADGSLMDGEASIVNHCDDPLLGGFVVNVRDVSERNILEAEIEHRSFHDPLTGLANRGLLQERVRQALSRSSRNPNPHALLLLDIDDFKAVNDSLGHWLGDELIRQVAQRLSPYVRSHDTLARTGGDEFALLVENIDESGDALSLADRMLDALAEPVDLNGQPYVIRASIGVAMSDGSGPGQASEQAAELLRNAELAMYEAKRQGGSSIEVFAARMHDAVTRRLALKAELVLALQREEFSLVYQPIVDVAERRIAGYEALVRWIHPERGMVSPADFIPIAEQTGLIVELGTWVLREACHQLAAWQPGWADERYVSVNVAGQQLQQEDFGGLVRQALRTSGLPAHQLLLEMTESSLIADTAGSERTMGELRDLGVRLAIDDFGTGYSSLSYLHRFSVDVLKIDKAFIDNITIDGPGNALVDAIVNMAGSLQLKVVAEGIEEPEQVEALALMRCELGQGYHYSRPLPVGDVQSFVLAPGPAAPPIVTLRVAS